MTRKQIEDKLERAEKRITALEGMAERLGDLETTVSALKFSISELEEAAEKTRKEEKKESKKSK